MFTALKEWLFSDNARSSVARETKLWRTKCANNHIGFIEKIIWQCCDRLSRFSRSEQSWWRGNVSPEMHRRITPIFSRWSEMRKTWSMKQTRLEGAKFIRNFDEPSPPPPLYPCPLRPVYGETMASSSVESFLFYCLVRKKMKEENVRE